MQATKQETAHGERSHSIGRQMSKWVDQVLGPSFNQFCPSDSWQPAINLYEDGTHYYVVADLAGTKPDEIDLRVEKGVMMLTGQRVVPEPAEAQHPVRLHLMEIDHGRFCRKIDLPGDVDVSSISATYRNGYLWIRLPRAK